MKWLALTLATTVLAYPIAGNLFLQLGGIDYAFASTEQTKVKFGSAWTLWPGTVHVSDLWLMIKDHNVQCVIQVREAEIDLALWELTKRKFHATRVRASGVSVRARHRVTVDKLDEFRVAALPDLPGVNEPPVFIGPSPPPIPDADYDLWNVRLDDVDAQVRELWIQQVHYVGNGHVRGSFEIKPARALSVGPASIDFAPGTVSLGKHVTLARCSGRIETTIETFDVRPITGVEMLKFVSARVKLDADLANADALLMLLDTDLRIDLEQRQPRLGIHVTLDRGELRTGSEVALRGERLRGGASRLAFSFDAPWALTARVTQDDSQHERHVGLRLSAQRMHVTDAKFPHAPVAARNVDAIVHSTSARLDQTWSFRDARVKVGHVRVPKLAVLNRSLPPTAMLHFEDGSATLHGNARYTHAAGLEHATLDATLHHAEVSIADVHVHASGSLHATLAKPPSRRRHIEAHCDLSDLAIDDPERVNGSTRPRVFFASRAQGKLDVTLARQQVHAGTLALRLSTADTRWGDFRIEADADVTMALAHADAGGLARTLSASLVAQKARFTSGTGAPEHWHAVVPRLSIKTSLRGPDADLGNSPMRGSLLIQTQRMLAHVGTVSMRARVLGRFQVDTLLLDQRSGILRGSALVTRAVVIRQDDPELPGWWARINVRPTYVNAAENFDVDGAFSVKMRDGMPALLLLTDRGELPGWVSDVTSLDHVESQLRIARRCRFTDLQITHASGGGFSMTGRLQNVPGRTTGALQAEVRDFDALSLGVALTNEGSEVELFATDDWMTKQQLQLQATSVQQLNVQACAPSPRERDQPRGADSDAVVVAAGSTTNTTAGAESTTGPTAVACAAPKNSLDL